MYSKFAAGRVARNGEDFHFILSVLTEPHVANSMFEHGTHGNVLDMLREFSNHPTNTAVIVDHLGDPAAIFLNRAIAKDVFQVHPMISAKYVGKGNAVEYLKSNELVLRGMGAKKMFGFPPWNNFATCRLFEKYGFKTEGRLKDSWLTAAGRQDRVVYGFLLED